MTNLDNMDWLLEDDQEGKDARKTTEFVQEVISQRVKVERDIPEDETFEDDEHGESKFGAEVDLRALDRLQNMNDKSKRATVYHLSNVVKKGEFHYAPGEPSTIEEFMSSALDANDISAAEFSDLSFIAGQLIPFLVDNSIPNAAVLWAAGYKLKSRAAVPVLRWLFKTAPPNVEEEIKKIIQWIVDPGISVRAIEDYGKETRGLVAPDPAYAYETILADGQTDIVIKCASMIQRNAIVKRLKNLIDLHSTPPISNDLHEDDDIGAEI